MVPAAISVLLAEDDARLGALVREALAQQGIDATLVEDGGVVLDRLRRGRFDAALLDVMMPGLDGFEVCRRIRSDPQLARLPVIMVTARGDDVDKVVGLELGADDYLAKPYSTRELGARIRALLRRAAAPPPIVERLVLGALVIDLAARTVTVHDREVSLTFVEFELLAALGRAAGRVLSREQLYQRLKGESFDAFDRVIDVHISKLRAKLEDDPKAPRWIRTVRGVGYVLSTSER